MPGCSTCAVPAACKQNPVWQRRWLMASSCACVLVVIVTAPTHWSWPLLPWGVLIGLAGPLAFEVAARYIARQGTLDEGRAARLHQRRII